MKILFATMPFDGHFNPLTGIAAHLRRQGHDVRWYAGASYQRRLSDLGVPGFVFRRAREVNGENIHDLFPERARLKGPGLLAFDGEKIFVAEVHEHYRDIVDIRTDFDFDALFCDAAFYAATLVAKKIGVPVYTVGVGPMLATSRDVPPPFFGLKPAPTMRGKVRHRLVRAMLHSTLRRSVKAFNEVLAVEGLPPVSVGDWFDLPHRSARRYFQDGVPGMDYPRSDLPENVTFVGSLVPAGKELPPELTNRLRNHPDGTVVVSQGTVDNRDTGKLIEPALNAFRDLPHLVVVTTGGTHTDELRRQFPQDKVLIEDYLDFGSILKYARAFVCNGGYGSVMSALEHGVPVLGAGSREGKNDINARLDHLGLGVDLGTERPTADQLRVGLARVLHDRRIAQNVERIRQEFAAHRPLGIIDHCLAEDGLFAPSPR